MCPGGCSCAKSSRPALPSPDSCATATRSWPSSTCATARPARPKHTRSCTTVWPTGSRDAASGDVSIADSRPTLNRGRCTPTMTTPRARASASSHPSESSQPDASPHPDASSQPDASSHPDASPHPDASFHPDASSRPAIHERLRSQIIIRRPHAPDTAPLLAAWATAAPTPRARRHNTVDAPIDRP